jgi:hypothetical protein
MSSFPSPSEMPEIPNLDEFVARVTKASTAVDEFAQTTTTATATTNQQSMAAPQASDGAMSRELINMLSLIHDEAIAIRGLLENLTK